MNWERARLHSSAVRDSHIYKCTDTKKNDFTPGVVGGHMTVT